MSSDDGPGPEVTRRLGYLFKHAAARMDELNADALAPYGIDSRELGVLLVLAGREPDSQQQAADRLGVDRTTMVASLDRLEAKGLVARHPSAEDRRRNVVELTRRGREVVARAVPASEAAEAQLLASLTPTQSRGLRTALARVVAEHDR